MPYNRQRLIYIIGTLIFIAIIAVVLYSVFFNSAVPFVPANETEVARLSTTKTVTLTPPPTATLAPATPSATAAVVISDTATPAPPTSTPNPVQSLPDGGIIYAISPDINSVGWVQSNQATNHFGESYIYVGNRNEVEYVGAMQFDLSFVPAGSTIFLAELTMEGLVDEGLPAQGTWIINLLDETVSNQWSSHGYDVISNAPVDEIVTPFLEAEDLARGRTNTIELNAAQRALIQERLRGRGSSLAIRIDGRELGAEGWFAWDSGFGDASLGNGPVLRLGIIAATPQPTEELPTPTPGTPTATPTAQVVTSTPTPENVFTAAAIASTATAQATTTGTATPVPASWVTPFAVTAVPTPANQATAEYISAEETAKAILFGTATSTPINMYTVTPTPVFVLLDGELPATTPTPTPTPDNRVMPPVLIGKIAFLSNRGGGDEPQVYVINPDGTGLGLLTDRWPYDMALTHENISADGRFRTYVKNALIDTGFGPDVHVQIRLPAIYYYDEFYKTENQITQFNPGLVGINPSSSAVIDCASVNSGDGGAACYGVSYDPVWSPTQEQVAFVSNNSGNDEIWIANRDGSNLRQLTQDDYNAWDKHPSFSPDGSQIVFWSNRTGTQQIWIMNTDGTGLRSLSKTGFNDWNPVWIKYPASPQPYQ